MRSFAALAIFALSTTNASGAALRPNSTGFYPLWENTAVLERSGDIYAGTGSLHMGIANRAQVGTVPSEFVYRAPNAFAKFKLLEKGDWTLAGQASIFHLLERTSDAFMSPMYVSRLENSDYSINVLPLAGIATLRVTNWFSLHQTATAMTIFSSGPLKDEMTFGYSAVAELHGRLKHSLLFHVAEVGFWNHDFSVLGASYRYQGSWAEFRLGYFYRIRQGSSQSSPMIGAGFAL